ncbi:hypothetical protein ACTJIJ_22695 [Niabella sp. 22666]|uniref:hypothetical protein n=1 Tax=Niabella sp. 22666 TaxID=3453954 RepID=UPI003F876FAE
MNTAIIKEINKEYIEAVELYEKDIKNSAFLESYINLAFLYWCFAFELFEFNIPNSISENWSAIGGNRYSKILELGLNHYPDSIELNFWQKYFSHISFGEEFSENDCKQLIEKYGDDESIVPYFYLYLFDKKKYEVEKNKLLVEYSKQPTAKNIYIRSILEGK